MDELDEGGVVGVAVVAVVAVLAVVAAASEIQFPSLHMYYVPPYMIRKIRGTPYKHVRSDAYFCCCISFRSAV